jgi:hypothetical protein
MLGKGTLKSLIQHRRVDQGIKKNAPITVREHKHFVFRYRLAGGFRERGHTKICQLPPLKLRGARDQSLGRFVDSKSEAFLPRSPVFLRCRGHIHASS